MEIKVRDLTVHYEEVGSGRPVLILHGWGLTGRTMTPIFEPLFEKRPGWRRLYLDLPGHGQTPVPDWLREQDDMVDVALEFMDMLAPGERFLVMGQSWGGYLARGIVHHRLKQVDGVVFYVPVIQQGELRSPLPARQVIHHDPAFLAALQPGEEWLIDLLVAQTLPVLEDFRANYSIYMTPQDPAIAQILSGKSFTFDPGDLPEPCPAPTLFIMGRQDHWVGYKDAWTALDAFPRGTFAVIDHAGHFLSGEQPILSLALLSEWLNRVEEYVAPNPP